MKSTNPNEVRGDDHPGVRPEASVSDLPPAVDLMNRVEGRFTTLLADPPWRFQNRTGKMAPEHQRLLRYPTLDLEAISALPINQLCTESAHLYLWVPNALLAEGLQVMQAWGFTYKTNLVWYKVRRDGGPDGRGVGFYFRNVTELLLFGVRGSLRTLAAGRTQVNLLATRKREHSRKPEEVYELIERCSPGPYLELFARFPRPHWQQWGNETVEAASSESVPQPDVISSLDEGSPFLCP
ncbi:MAG: S-adenosylmethionine-binding protein [Gammaproteobacteria bacterium]|jgi:N6-adenosine-specific RNA methylase IME4|nr:S-adenosylmethionine-binding protein [Gammaproteobacteria bacterium]